MAPLVIVKTPQVMDVENYYEFTGNTTATEDVEIKSRVSGYLLSVDFVEGANVKKGDLLFTIEPDIYEARVIESQALILAGQAELTRAQLDYERAEKALLTNAVSKQDVATKKAAFDQAKAAVMAAEADLKIAQLSLSYTKVVSPISGRISRKFVDVGNLLVGNIAGSGESTLLATVVATQPMYVYFNASEDMLKQEVFSSVMKKAADANAVFYVGLTETDSFPYQGTLNYIDNVVDAMTGTVAVRGSIPNKENTLLPGMFVRIKVPTGITKDAIVIDEQSIVSDLGGKYVLIADKENTAQKRPVKLGTKINGLVVVESGISKDDRYIVKGFHFVRPGAPVTPMTEEQMAAMKAQQQQGGKAK
jgi:multidrug efflux system membrane fusion protein